MRDLGYGGCLQILARITPLGTAVIVCSFCRLQLHNNNHYTTISQRDTDLAPKLRKKPETLRNDYRIPWYVVVDSRKPFITLYHLGLSTGISLSTASDILMNAHIFANQSPGNQYPKKIPGDAISVP